VLENVYSDATSNHFEVCKTQEKLQKYVYWRGHRADVERFVRQCATCCRYRHGLNPKQGPMQLSHGCTASTACRLNWPSCVFQKQLQLFPHCSLQFLEIFGRCALAQ